MLKIEEIKSDAAGNGVVVLKLEGRIDINTSADLDFAAEPHVQGPNRLVVDLSGIQYVSSAGLRVFLLMAKKLQKAQGKLVLCSMNAGVREVFDLSGFSKILQIESDSDAALKRIAG